MRSWLAVAVLPVALAAATFLLAPSRSDAAAQVVDITGGYSGRFLFKVQPMTGVEAASRGPDPATVTVSQTGANVAFNISLDTPAGPKNYNIGGSYGRNLFFATGSSPDGDMVLTGKATGQAPKIVLKGSVVLVASTGITTFTFTLKQVPPG